MDAIDFPESTKKLGAPPGFTKDEVFDLPVNEGFYFIRGFNPVACLTSCWQMTNDDWQKWRPDKLSPEAWLLFKPKAPNIYVSIMGFGMPAISMSPENPFAENFNKEIGKYYHEHGKFPAEYQEKLQKEINEARNRKESD